ncbi:hypothetical protein EMIHUDRAFT_118574 [Emiliania huxleyi CCMP1516]|uniref:N-acetyltransferase domain-containing protein n=2 Tax=Emiliania huxleyi TaxID=2903 RepID=A0A0D3J1W6_EMIH1|nr:hypothetical protein EMIHUDRAFT_118574 [Emiliania huxleyi CCMP1516]EOD17501.1 hypothetical protein EMIHUDRAFT_118574 [Emiliania huxleyi CCMP1516]|eukprot:XP_005769930.1 hypothetical protein EMIHUDRAFT_118574 [Emiliania huxleyi CCMP1516]
MQVLALSLLLSCSAYVTPSRIVCCLPAAVPRAAGIVSSLTAFERPFGGKVLTPPTTAAQNVAVSLRRAKPSDAVAIATICTDSFYGEHELKDGPIKFSQRAAVWSKVYLAVSRRLQFEGQRECRLVVASDARGGPLIGCVDLAVHLFNTQAAARSSRALSSRETPAPDACEADPVSPKPRCRLVPRSQERRPYVASLAVDRAYRRRGVARCLVGEAERVARSWGHGEVSAQNEPALAFYRREGYRVVRSDVAGTGAEEVDTSGLWWSFYQMPKYILRKRLFPGRGAPRTD